MNLLITKKAAWLLHAPIRSLFCLDSRKKWPDNEGQRISQLIFTENIIIMENTLRIVVVFVWSFFFGFYSWTAYLDDTMTSSSKIMILGGLLVVLAAYLAIELYTHKTKSPSPLEKVHPPISADERILRRLHAAAEAGGSTKPSAPLKPRPTTIAPTKN